MLFTNLDKQNLSNDINSDIHSKLPIKLSYQAVNNDQTSPLINSNIGGGVNPSINNSPTNNLISSPLFDICTSNDCNRHGNCLGFRSAPLCSCNAGYIGINCENVACDNNQHCSGRGICLGTVNQHICFCNLGYNGNQCQNQI
ncbi:hypothetical protein Mgra_00002247 [Meloidogyne graminicola]|uniref:EGF-like domain-containing protein n=1 Tax=Meloidogyne graminicola TaxID=189291 RepID=A0A8S9ZZF9_9BILA|nr:hypothetical protein Mgra_00002247 [Meloidogyne graminicola]